MITHRAIQTAMLVNALEQDVLPFDRFLMSNPMCHASGFSVLHFHVRARCSGRKAVRLTGTLGGGPP
jgi:hypothetical protein